MTRRYKTFLGTNLAHAKAQIVELYQLFTISIPLDNLKVIGFKSCPRDQTIMLLRTLRFRGLFAVRILAGNFVRGSIVEAAEGKLQRKIGEGGRGAMSQL